MAPELLTDCAQLTKANSIEGNKKDNVTIIYTPWSNLRKDGSMAAGQVAFKSEKLVKKIHVPQRENPIVNRLNKTRVEKFPDLRTEKDDALRQSRKKDQASQRERVGPCISTYLVVFMLTELCVAKRRGSCGEGAQGEGLAARSCVR